VYEETIPDLEMTRSSLYEPKIITIKIKMINSQRELDIDYNSDITVSELKSQVKLQLCFNLMALVF
jgi:hypothetical protein